MTVYKSDPKSKLKKKKTVPRLPQGVRNIKRELNAAFNQWKSESQPTDSVSYFHYRNKKTEYRQALRNFIANKENEKIAMLCDTLGVNEKQFWQMIKPKRTIRSGSHFILNGRVLSSDIDILDIWVSHFENLGKPSTEPHYDEDFKEYIDGKVKHILQKCLNSSSCIEDIFGFEKVKKVCLNLPCNKAGGIDNTAYEHLKFGRKQLWQVLSDLFVFMYSTHNVPSSLKIQLLLPIFKGKKLKAIK